MQTLSLNPNLAAKQQRQNPLTLATRPAFGSAAGAAGVWGFLFENPYMRPISEDVMAFTITRTFFDLIRGFLYKKENKLPPTTQHAKAKEQLNIPAARERLIRELGMVFASNFLNALTFTGIFYAIKTLGLKKNLTMDFISHEQLSVIESLVKNSPNSTAFVENLAKQVAPEHYQSTLTKLNEIFKHTDGQKITKTVRERIDRLSSDIVKAVKPGQTYFNWSFHLPNGKQEAIALNDMLTSSAKFLNKMQGATHWQNESLAVIKRTNRFNRWATLPALGFAALFTLAVPYYNKILTAKIDKIESYPGIKGLAELKHVEAKKSWVQRTFPYYYEQYQKGKLWPFVTALASLPFAVGIIDNAALRGGHWKAAINSPFKKGFWENWHRMFQFRHKALGSLQQLAALCALVCFGRVVMARDKFEFRERLIDTYGAWATWIVLVPLLSRKMGQLLDGKVTKMMKTVAGHVSERSKAEVKHFFDQSLSEKTLNTSKKLSRWTLFGVMVPVLGVLEPLIAIKWTESQIHRDNVAHSKALSPKSNVTYATATLLADPSTALNKKPFARYVHQLA